MVILFAMRTSGLINGNASVMALLARKLFAASAGTKRNQATDTRVDLSLSRGQVERVRQSGGLSRIECHEGRVWITQSGRPEDIILKKGQMYDCAEDGLIVMEALSAAKVTFKG
jgi:ferric-dicitrate binding protein FerR (iron transport regulator)